MPYQKIKSFLLVNQGLKQTVIKNTFWLFGSEIASRLLKLILIVYAARVLDASGWGVFSYGLSLITLFFFFSDVGLNSLVTREASKPDDRGTKVSYLSTAFYIKIFLSLAALLLSLTVAPHVANVADSKVLIPVVTLIIFFETIREFGLALNRAFEKMEREALVKAVTNSLIAVLGILFLVFGSKSAMSLAIAYAIGSGLGMLLIFWILRGHLGELISHYSKNVVGKIISSSWSLALIGLLGSIMANTDTVMLGFWRSSAEIGWYAASQRLLQFLLLIPVMFSMAILPSFSRFAHTDNVKFRTVLEKSISLVTLIALPLMIGGIILGKEIILLVFGAGYLPAVPVFQIWMLSLVLAFPNILIGNAIFAYDRQKETLVYLILSLLLNISLNYFWIPTYGIIGSAMATLISGSLIAIFLWFKMKKINDFTTLPYLKKILLASLLMGVLVFLLRTLGLHVIINALISSIFYFSLLYFLKEPLIGEFRALLVYPQN